MAINLTQNSFKISCGENWRGALARLQGAYAESTIRAYRADMEVFEEWCKKNRKSFLPAHPETVAIFVSQQAQEHANATLKRRLAAIRKIHKLMKLDNPAVDEEVLIALRRALRMRPSRPRQAMGLTRDLRDRLITACPPTIQGKRDRALIALGYDTLCRRSELVALRIEDLQTTSKGATKILIRRSKNDPYGNGRMSYIAADTLRLLQTWLKVAKIETGYLFRGIRHTCIDEAPLHPFSVNRILKQTARRAGFSEKEIRDLSGHSMRVGAAQDMISDGLDILPIMQAGGWRSTNIVARYIENADLSNLLQNARTRQGCKRSTPPV